MKTTIRIFLLTLLGSGLLFSGCSEEKADLSEKGVSKIFYFSPPEEFSDDNIYWKNYHYIAEVDDKGVKKSDLVRFDGPAMNFSQSSYDPDDNVLYTWKKNYRDSGHPVGDYIIKVHLPENNVEAVARIPKSGKKPLMALDFHKKRIMITEKAKLTNVMIPSDFFVYDLLKKNWQSGRFSDFRFVTLDYFENEGNFVGVAIKNKKTGGIKEVLVTIDGSGKVLKSRSIDLLGALKRPVLKFDNKGLPNNPGIQSRILNKRIILIRYYDFGRDNWEDPFRWVYEVYQINLENGEIVFVNEFK